MSHRDEASEASDEARMQMAERWCASGRNLGETISNIARSIQRRSSFPSPPPPPPPSPCRPTTRTTKPLGYEHPRRLAQHQQASTLDHHRALHRREGKSARKKYRGCGRAERAGPRRAHSKRKGRHEGHAPASRLLFDADTNCDGRLSFKGEFVSRAGQSTCASEQRPLPELRSWFNLIDSDGSGSVSL